MKTTNDSIRARSPRFVAMTLLAVVSTVLLAACSSSSSPTSIPPTRMPKPTFTTVVDTPTPAPSPTPVPSPTPTINPYFDPLTGEVVQDVAVLQRRPLLVRIGNDPEVRPQSGLSQADIVLEEIVERWVTRLTAVVWSKDPEELRPIRSARLLTIELGYMFDGVLVHSGANDQVRWFISQSTLVDLDSYFHPAPYYRIEPEGAWKDYPWMGRDATSAKRVRDYLARTGKEKAVSLAGFTFSGEGDPTPDGEPAAYVHIPYPERALVEYRYDLENRVYKRFVQGEPHTDALDDQQLAAANVIVHYTKHEETDVVDVRGVPTLNIIFTGEGRARIFRDGVMIEAKWIRLNPQDFCEYMYLDGSPVPLRPGQTWIEVVPTDYQVTYEAE